MILINSEIEYTIITLFLTIVFFAGLKRRKNYCLDICKFASGGANQWLTIDFSFSQAIKGLACVMILMGHYRTFFLSDSIALNITTIVGMSSANIALFFFMFFSGYGLSLKDYNNVNLIREWTKRIKKILYPLFITGIIMLLLYALLPDNMSQSEVASFHVSKILHEVHTVEINNISTIILAGLGWGDWYVTCIIMFYTLFYLSLFIWKTTKINQTIALSVLMLCYFVWAYFFYGLPEAHYFRYPWVFMLGHVVARWRKNSSKISLAVLVVFALTEYPCGLYYHIFSIAAIVILTITAFINTAYKMESKYLLFMGSISYLYYLCHGRIACTLLAYTGIKSLLLWAVVTIPIAWGLTKLVSKIKG